MIWVCFAPGLWMYSKFTKIELAFTDVDIFDVTPVPPMTDEQKDEDVYRRFTG